MLTSILFSILASISSTTEVNGIPQVKPSLEVPFVLVNDFTEDSAKKFSNEMKAARDSGAKIILIEVDSYGGHVHSLLNMVGVVKAAQDAGIKVATFVSGKSMSCGAVLFACGSNGYRFSNPYATIMIHYVSSGAEGKVPDMITDANEADRLNTLLFSLLDKSAGKPDGFFMSIVKSKGGVDWYITPKEALDLGLVNKIKVPEAKIKMTTESTIE